MITTTTKIETEIPAKTARMLLRLVRATQPVSRIELARRLGINRSTVTDIFKPLIAAGILRETALKPRPTQIACKGARQSVCRSTATEILSSA